METTNYRIMARLAASYGGSVEAIDAARRAAADLEDWLDRVEALLYDEVFEVRSVVTDRLLSDDGWVNPAGTVTAWVTFDDPNVVLVAFTAHDDGAGDEVERWARRELDI